MEGGEGGGKGGRRGGETETQMHAYTYKDLSHQFLVPQTFRSLESMETEILVGNDLDLILSLF